MSFLPRVNSEVLISYINGNIDRPIIIGTLHNSLERATLEVKVSDDLKSVVVPHRLWRVSELYQDNWGFAKMD
ncbi:hypothetical protein [Sulfuricurvum sp.]|uniref:hypothetical protein n=1 Tax=Sulfuricurvum sp. TaxID=2025608 RepID=UPI00261F3001|nr:hypothetical protein [Sulfuricurvum sp.]MDD3597510.1 hypothetical protein [Sulfuricurvum sp.]